MMISQKADQEPLCQEPGCSSKAGCLRPALSIPSALCLLVLIVLVEIGGSRLFSRLLLVAANGKALWDEELWLTALLRLIDLGLILLFAFRSGYGISAIGIRPKEWRRGIRTGLTWSFVFGLTVMLIWAVAFFAFRVNFGQLLIFSPYPFSFWLLLLVGGTFAPMVEDSFFVGCLYNSLRRKLSPLWAILGVSLLFALLHNVRGIPATQFIGGLIFTLAFESSENLLTPIIIHILGNCALFTLAYSAWIRGIMIR
ncbi:MAG: CPBP family intramembrane metalloprotease [bacterium]|nr:CPBP family intramembrane metalloprotease [bacterium]